jgi:hypothetical protein
MEIDFITTEQKERLLKIGFKCDLPRPLKQQVFRWFRENHNIDGWVVPYHQLGGGKLYSYVYEEIDNAQELNVTDADDYKTYEEAENECINQLISLIEAKN